MSPGIRFARILLLPCLIAIHAFAFAGEAPPSFRVTDIEVVKDGGLYRLRGHIVNDSGEDLNEPAFDISFLDSRKRVITGGSIYAEGVLKAGGSGSFFGIAQENPSGWKSVAAAYREVVVEDDYW